MKIQFKNIWRWGSWQGKGIEGLTLTQASFIGLKEEAPGTQSSTPLIRQPQRIPGGKQKPVVRKPRFGGQGELEVLFGRVYTCMH